MIAILRCQAKNRFYESTQWAVGAVIITLVKNVVSTYVDCWNSLLGEIFVIVVVFMPHGLVPGFRQLWTRFQSTNAPQPAAGETASGETATGSRS